MIITEDALKAAVELSSRYINDRFLPDKAVDLVDETAAFKEHQFIQQIAKDDKKIESDLEILEQEKTKAVLNQDFTTALHLRTQEEKLLKQKSRT